MTIEEAFRAMKDRGWGFAKSRGGFTAVGPMVYGIVEVYGMDIDPVRAVEKALETYEKRKETK